jgi:hypothetical protein
VLLDERVYQAHPYIDTVVVFIADPGVHLPLADRESFEADLSQTVTVGGHDSVRGPSQIARSRADSSDCAVGCGRMVTSSAVLRATRSARHREQQ